MKITGVDTILVQTPAVTPPFKWRQGLNRNNGYGSEGANTMAWLAITTDEGITGLSACGRGVIFKDYVDRRFREMLIGRDPLDREFLFEEVWEIDRIERFPAMVTGVVDSALWDIAGKSAGLPVYKLLGAVREKILAYASTATFDTKEEFLSVADQVLDMGYTAIKLHAWGDVKRDADLCLALRDRVGPNVPLMYDGSAGFDLMDAVYLGEVLSEANYLWYEEPMREFNTASYKWLGERVDIPLLLGEVAEGAHYKAADFLSTGVAAALRTSTGLRGGFTGAMRIAHLADAYHLRAEVHGYGLEATHLCMAIKNNTYYESFISSSKVIKPYDVDSQGFVHAISADGIGYESYWEQFGIPKGMEKFANR
jgi:L-alanine-DL-glutamate epimerase-like enolase superfamily enzyme